MRSNSHSEVRPGITSTSRDIPLPPEGARAKVVAALRASGLRCALPAKLLRGERSQSGEAVVDDLIQEGFARLLVSRSQVTEARDTVAYLAHNLQITRMRPISGQSMSAPTCSTHPTCRGVERPTTSATRRQQWSSWSSPQRARRADPGPVLVSVGWAVTDMPVG